VASLPNTYQDRIAAEPMLRRDPGPVIEQYRADLPNIPRSVAAADAVLPSLACSSAAVWSWLARSVIQTPAPIVRRTSSRRAS
jgi:hypothetical protein